MTPVRSPERPPSRERFGALDVLRGLTVAAMIVVNNPGNWNSVFTQFQHSAWNGVTVADLIFPAFIFIMGVAMAFALTRARSTRTTAQLYRQVAMRSALLVLLGLILNVAAAWPHVGATRFPGVLQRIGVTYFFAALITLNTSDAGQWRWSGALLLAHWVVLAFPVAVSGHAALDQGHNVGFTIDRAVFGTHLLTPQGDPEGLLGTLSSIATALVGAAVGRWLLTAQEKNTTLSGAGDPLMKLTVAGLIAVSIGLVWSRVLPLNKPLWTGSFALLSCGVATLLLAACARLPATNAGRAFNPMLWLGTNPLAIYFLSELTSDLLQRPWAAAGHVAAPKDWLFWNVLAPIVGDSGGKLSSLVYAVVYTSVWIAIAGIMRWRGIRLRV